MLKTWLLIFFCFSLTILISADDQKERPTVTTNLGKIRGYHKKSAKRNLFAAFEGIPYAKPPTENRRFEPPEPTEPWKGVWDAISVTECAQTDLHHTDVVQGEEDCLYLNVYVPHEYPNPSEKLDVIVHIHGGLFMYGSGHSYSHPEYFMDEQVIFVNFNYRLGALGFLSTEDDVVSGNNGLKDQVVALKWVQENIASFGGNPDSVTLTGLSAGASSVHYHYLSDMSVGLFQKGFSQSGVALNSFALQDYPLNKAKALAEAVGCPTTSSSVLVKCLKQRPFKHLLTKTPQFFSYKFLPTSPFAPVLERGSKPFLNKNPYYLLAKGKIQDLPWLISTTSHEGLFPAAFFRNDLQTLNENWVDLAPVLLDCVDSLAQQLWKSTAEELKEMYVGKDQVYRKKNFEKLVQMVTDRFLVDVDSAVKLQAKNNKSPVYYYQFGYPGDFNTNKTVAHGEDAQYFFYSMYNRQPSKNELKMKENLMEMLLTFAKTGKPRIKDVNWKPVKFPEVQFLNISSFETDHMKLQSVKELAPRAFWKSLGLLENQNLVLIKEEL